MPRPRSWIINGGAAESYPMRHCTFGLLVGWICAALSGCGSSQHPSHTPIQAMRFEELVGKWHLVRVGGELPSSMNIKSLKIDIARDGTWISEIEMQGQFAGMSMKGGGKWSLADGIVTYT